MWQCKLDHNGGWILRNWYFWSQSWRRLLWVPWAARKSIQSTLKEINPENSLEGLMLRQKLQYYGYLMWRANSLAKTLMLWKIGAEEGEDGGPDTWMASPTQWIWVWTSSGSWSRARRHDILQSTGLWRVGHDWVIEQQIIITNNKATECIWPWVVSVSQIWNPR